LRILRKRLPAWGCNWDSKGRKPIGKGWKTGLAETAVGKQHLEEGRHSVYNGAKVELPGKKEQQVHFPALLKTVPGKDNIAF